jgi:hypothetical protein
VRELFWFVDMNNKESIEIDGIILQSKCLSFNIMLTTEVLKYVLTGYRLVARNFFMFISAVENQ